MGTFLRFVVFNIFVVSCALAAPPSTVRRPHYNEGGEARLKLGVEQGEARRLSRRTLKRGDLLSVVVSFDAPDLPEGGRAELVLRPLNGVVLAGAAVAEDGANSELAVTGTRVLSNVGAGVVPGSRVRLVVPFQPTGNLVSQLQAELLIVSAQGGSSISRASYTVGSDGDANVVRKKARELRREARLKIQSDPSRWLRANRVLPLEASKFPQLAKPSRVVELEGGVK